MRKAIMAAAAAAIGAVAVSGASPGSIYHKGWIDFNKNGVKDLYEDSSAPVDERVKDLLSRMTTDEKTC